MENSSSGTSRRGGTWGRSPPRLGTGRGGRSAGATAACASVRYLPDGSLAYASWDHRVAFLDPSGRLPARTPIDGGAAQVCGLSVDRAGRWLAVGWTDGHIGLHDAATGAVRRTIRGDGRRLALSPDGQWLATRRTGQLGPAAKDRPGQPPHHAGAASRPDRRRSPSVRTGRPLASTSWDRHHHALGHRPA